LKKNYRDQPSGHEGDFGEERASRSGGCSAGGLFYVRLQPDSIVGAAVVGNGTPEGAKALLGDGSGAGVIEVGAEGLASPLAAESAVGGASVLGVGPDTIISIRNKSGIAAVLLGVDGEFARKDVVVGPKARVRGGDRVAVVNKSIFGDE
jgi:hypothetical protein